MEYSTASLIYNRSVRYIESQQYITYTICTCKQAIIVSMNTLLGIIELKKSIKYFNCVSPACLGFYAR